LFRAGEALIPFLANHGDALRAQLHDEETAVLQECAMAALFPHGAAPALANAFVRPARVRHREQVIDLRIRESDGVARTRAKAVALPGGRRHMQAGAVDLFVDDVSFEAAGNGTAGSAANELRAPFNGKVIAVKAQTGAQVARGDTLLVLESMKLEHALGAARDGVIKSVHVEPGQQAATSQVLVTFEALQ
jgi:geranyl-CoA carboxylase alpha subunit